MLEREVRDKLTQYAIAIRELLTGVTGSVTFHLGKEQTEPKVEVRMCDVTRKKK